MKENSVNKENKGNNEIPLLEWLLVGIGFLLVLLTIGFLVYRVATGEKSPPDINVKVTEIRKTGEKYLVKFALENTGDETAADVTLEGEIKAGEQLIETSDVTVDYISSHSKKEGGMFFTEDPQAHDFKIRAKGYNNP